MRSIAIFTAIAVLGLALALSIGGVEALGGGDGNRDGAASYIKNDEDKEKGNGNGNGGGNGGGEAADHGNGNGGNENGGDHGNGNGGGDSDDENGNGNGNADAAGQGNGNGGANGDGGANANAADHENGDEGDDASDDDRSSKDKKDKDDATSDVTGDSDDDEDASEHQEGSKVRVCHLTDRDDYPYNLIEISENALPAHEDHGDFAAPDDADSSTDCDEALAATPVASPDEVSDLEASPEPVPVESEKVRVCHVTSSAKNPVILIEVSENALSAHEDHGDFEAPDDADSSNDCEEAAEPIASPEASPVVEAVG